MDAFVYVLRLIDRPQPRLDVSISLVHSQTGDGLALTSQLRVYRSPTFGVGPRTNRNLFLGLSVTNNYIVTLIQHVWYLQYTVKL